MLPDLATCPEVRAPGTPPTAPNRRYQYPFTNCTHCGPRYSILESLPYDRARTSMRIFTLCPNCLHEFEDPWDRRFHAQPLACPDCGPHVALVDPRGAVLARFTDALGSAARALRDGRSPLALKGPFGGFQLLVRADLPNAVARLRQRKHREAKPFAVMLRHLDEVRRYCHVSPEETRLLTSPASPIVLLDRRITPASAIADEVAPGHPSLGVMLPYTPLHHLLLARLDFPIVATSGNRSDEPLCTTEASARRDLAEIADLLLTHDRPIVRAVDDSVARVLLGTEQVLRRARGYAPLPLALPAFAARWTTCSASAPNSDPPPWPRGPLAFVSQHIGDLEFAATADAFLATAQSLPRLLGASRIGSVVDLHPDYFPTQQAADLGRSWPAFRIMKPTRTPASPITASRPPRVPP